MLKIHYLLKYEINFEDQVGGLSFTGGEYHLMES